MTARPRALVVSDVPGFYREPHKDHWGRIGIDATCASGRKAEFARKRIAARPGSGWRIISGGEPGSSGERPRPLETRGHYGDATAIHAPATTKTAPAKRATHRPHGVSFSRRTSSARSAIQSAFMTPTTNKSAMRTQQQPTQ